MHNTTLLQPVTEELRFQAAFLYSLEENGAANEFSPQSKNADAFSSIGELYMKHFDGGAGIRTPVREKIDHSVYVRIPPIEVSSRWPVDSPLLDKSP